MRLQQGSTPRRHGSRRRLKAESDVPVRSHGSISLNRALLTAGLVDRLQVMVFPVVSGQIGADPHFAGAPTWTLGSSTARRWTATSPS
jgi:dihydrofolate reductase